MLNQSCTKDLPIYWFFSHHVIVLGIKWNSFWHVQNRNIERQCVLFVAAETGTSEALPIICWNMNLACGIASLSAASSASVLKADAGVQAFFSHNERSLLVPKQHKVIHSSSLWCCAVIVKRRRAQLASYSNSSSFTLGWPGLACPLGSSVSLHPSIPSFFDLSLSLSGSFSSYFSPLLCDLTICLCASSGHIALTVLSGTWN